MSYGIKQESLPQLLSRNDKHSDILTCITASQTIQNKKLLCFLTNGEKCAMQRQRLLTIKSPNRKKKFHHNKNITAFSSQMPFSVHHKDLI